METYCFFYSVVMLGNAVLLNMMIFIVSVSLHNIVLL